MKKLSLIVVFIIFSKAFYAIELPSNNFQVSFNKAYLKYPGIPKGMLEAVSYAQSRFHHIQPSAEGSCTGLPKAYGIMGLTLDGKGYFRNNLLRVAELSTVSIEEIVNSPEKNIEAYAKAYSQLVEHFKPSDISEHSKILIELSELPLDSNIVNNFALNTQLYQIFWFLTLEEAQGKYGFPNHNINMEKIFGKENLKILSAKSIKLGSNWVKGNDNLSYKLNFPSQTQSADYAPALWNPAASCNYSSRNGTAVSAITIHDVEGSYSGCISWFQNCNANVSAHYVLRSSDGQITQMVLEANKAWHVGSENPYTIGFEHEGYVATGYNWYTTAMMTASADLVRDICLSSGYSINPLRCYNGPSCNGICTLGGCVKIKGHQHYANQSHSDPGQYWDWYKFYNLINNNPTTTTITTASGTIYDSGGASGNYLDDERNVILIQPAGATSITLNFSQFNLENNWDYLFIYDGANVNSNLIGRYTGTTSPGVITSSTGSLLLDFRSDCATTNPGWAATYTSNAAPPLPSDNTAPSTQVFSNGNWQTQNFTAAILDNDNTGGSGVEKGYYQVIDYDGTEWRANHTRGFFSDNFDQAIHSEWTLKTGVWGINTQSLEQTDENLSNTNIYAPLTQNLSNRYLYHFYAKIDGAGTNRRAGFHFFCDNPDSTNRGNSYFVWFRVDDSKLQIYKTVNNVFGAPLIDVAMTVSAGQWYDYKVIYDRITGKISVFQNNALVGSYTDPSPLSNGSHISFRSGNASLTVNELKVYRSRSSSINVNVGNVASGEARFLNPDPQTYACKIKSICQDSAGNLSPIYYHNVNIDWTPPMTIDSIRDGLGNDIAVTNQLDRLSSNWEASYDTNSAVLRYWHAIGTSPGDSNIVAWNANLLNTTYVTDSNLVLQQGQVYYYAVKAENGAGLFSPVIISNGQMVDTNVIVSIKDRIEWSELLNVYPNPAYNQLIIELLDKQIEPNSIEIYDVLGKAVLQPEIINETNTNSNKFTVNIENLKSGCYYIIVKTNNGKCARKFMKY